MDLSYIVTRVVQGEKTVQGAERRLKRRAKHPKGIRPIFCCQPNQWISMQECSCYYLQIQFIYTYIYLFIFPIVKMMESSKTQNCAL